MNSNHARAVQMSVDCGSIESINDVLISTLMNDSRAILQCLLYGPAVSNTAILSLSGVQSEGSVQVPGATGGEL